MKAVDEICTVLEAMRTDANSNLQSWQYNSPARANVENDFSDTPTAVAFCLTDWQVTQGVVREIADVAVGFLTTQPNLDFDGLHNEQRVDEMKDIALDFIARVKSRGIFVFEDDPIKMRSVYDTNDANLTGVFVEVKMRELAGKCLNYYDSH